MSTNNASCVRLCCRVVVSPHVYPPTITFAKSAFTGPAFWTRMSYSFGYFNTVRLLCHTVLQHLRCQHVLHSRVVSLAVLRTWGKMHV
jgi:hypothetical protein